MQPMILLEPFHTLHHILKKVMAIHMGAPVTPALMPLLLVACS